MAIRELTDLITDSDALFNIPQPEDMALLNEHTSDVFIKQCEGFFQARSHGQESKPKQFRILDMVENEGGWFESIPQPFVFGYVKPMINPNSSRSCVTLSHGNLWAETHYLENNPRYAFVNRNVLLVREQVNPQTKTMRYRAYVLLPEATTNP